MNPTPNWHDASDEDILNVDLIDALGMAAEPDDVKLAFLARMTDTVQKAVALRLIQTLDPTTKAQLDQLLDGDNPEQINAFLTQHVPNFEALTIEETVKFKRAMLAGSTAKTV